jgi:hypothetical protein
MVLGLCSTERMYLATNSIQQMKNKNTGSHCKAVALIFLKKSKLHNNAANSIYILGSNGNIFSKVSII